MRKIALFLSLLLLLGSCKEDSRPSPISGTNYIFYPRPCEHVMLAVNAFQGSILNSDSLEFLLMTGQDPVKYYKLSETGTYPASYFKYEQEAELKLRGTLNMKGWVEGVFWYGYHNKAPFSPKNVRLEQELELDISTKSRARSIDTRSSGMVYANLLSIQYRTTGVRGLKVSADKALWGVASGQSLNEYLRIVDMSPRQIISSESERLLVGYQSKQKVTELSEWLSLKPMAQPGMWLSFKSTPEELSDTPMDIKFTVELTTNEGVVLTDTLDVKLVR